MFKLTGIAAAAWGLFVVGAAVAQTVSVKIAVFTPPPSVVTKSLDQFADEMTKGTNGAVSFQRFWGGSLGRNPTKQYELVRNGVTDIGLFVPSYTPGAFPDFGIFELPFLVRNAMEASLAEGRMHDRGLLGGIDEVHAIGFFSNDAYHLHLRHPIKTFEDVAGLKVRAAGPIQADILRRIGATSVFMPITGVPEALDRRVIDGLLAGWAGLPPYKLDKLTTHHYEVPFGTLPFVIAMNKEKWDSLPPNAKAAFKKYGGEYLARLGASRYDAASAAARARLAKEPGRVIIVPGDAESKRLAAKLKPVHDAWISSVKDGQKKYDGLVKILHDLRSRS